MFWIVLLCSAIIVRGEALNMESRYTEEEEEELMGASAETTERSWKVSKRGIGYLLIGVVMKALFWIKLALGKLAILGNISIILSKLSLILTLLLTFGKYFAGLGKMLNIKDHHAQGSYHYPGRVDYLT